LNKKAHSKAVNPKIPICVKLLMYRNAPAEYKLSAPNNKDALNSVKEAKTTILIPNNRKKTDIWLAGDLKFNSTVCYYRKISFKSMR
jgi:hypothetical protein